MSYSSKENLGINLRSLDALRGFLAIYVLLGHARWLLWAGNAQWNQTSHPWWSNLLAYSSASLRYGHEAVMLFFVLSGFFIHLRISKQLSISSTKSNFNFDYINFFQRRCHRLIPPYLVAFALTIVFDVVGRHFFPTLYKGLTGDTLLDQNFIRKTFSPDSVLPAILMLPSSLGKDFGTNGVLWSLAYEVIYYLMYPLWLILRRVGFFQAYTFGIVCAIIFSFTPQLGFLSSVAVHYPIWLTGAYLAEITTRHKSPNYNYIGIASCFSLILTFVLFHLSISTILKTFLYIFFGLSGVYLAINLPWRFTQTRIHYFFEMLGIESYTIYICHFPILSFISAWTIETFRSRPLHGWLSLIGTLLTLFISHICFVLCERHFLHPRIKLE